MHRNSPGGGLSLPQGVEAVEWTGLVVMILVAPIVYFFSSLSWEWAFPPEAHRGEEKTVKTRGPSSSSWGTCVYSHVHLIPRVIRRGAQPIPDVMRTIITGLGLPASPKASPALHGGPIPPMTELLFGVGNSEEDSAGHETLNRWLCPSMIAV